MKRVVLSTLACVCLVAVVPPALASDASLEHALKAYKTRLTADIAYLASFSAPSKKGVGATLKKLSKVKSDLTGAEKAASSNQASTRSVAKGRTEVLSALSDALVAVGDARGSAKAARSGKRSTATRDAKKAVSEMNKAIPLFESAGKLLHLF